jgi:ADP-heptose:LPS heptosyltransferase
MRLFARNFHAIAVGWRILNIFRKHVDRFKQFFQKPLLRYGKRIARNAIRSWLIPWRRSAHIFAGAALGDALMCTPAMRALKQANPRCRIHFYTDYPDLVRGLWYLDDISPTDKCPPRRIWMGYEDALPLSGHLARIIGQRLGVRVKDVRPDCYIDETLVEQFRSTWRDLPRPHILVQRRASSFTPNKNWPHDSWETLIGEIAKTATVIEIGQNSEGYVNFAFPNYIDLRGKTDVRGLVASIAAADILVAPVSGPVHIASAVRTPAVVILGGYELPENTVYSGNRILYTSVECSPCWLRTPCPIDRECLRRISPESARKAIDEVWTSRLLECRKLPDLLVD